MSKIEGTTAKKTEPIIQEPPPKKHGLCYVCKIEAVCTYPKNRPNPIIFCEEFVPYESRPAKNPPKKLKFLKTSSGEEEREESRYKGLCRTCDIRESCVFPKPEGGVWRCEEYR